MDWPFDEEPPLARLAKDTTKLKCLDESARV
jgi:hypothetical protein